MVANYEGVRSINYLIGGGGLAILTKKSAGQPKSTSSNIEIQNNYFCQSKKYFLLLKSEKMKAQLIRDETKMYIRFYTPYHSEWRIAERKI